MEYWYSWLSVLYSICNMQILNGYSLGPGVLSPYILPKRLLTYSKLLNPNLPTIETSSDPKAFILLSPMTMHAQEFDTLWICENKHEYYVHYHCPAWQMGTNFLAKGMRNQFTPMSWHVWKTWEWQSLRKRFCWAKSSEGWCFSKLGIWKK